MSNDSPVVIIYDENSKPLAISDGTTIPAGQPGYLIVGKDGTVARFVKVASDGTVRIDPSGTTTQPVSGTVTSNIGTTNGLALDNTLTGGGAKAIAKGGTKGSTVAAEVTSTSIDANHQGIDIADGGGSITVDGTVAVSGTVPVSVASLPLPTGAATETTLALINNKTAPLGQTTMAGSSPVTIASNQSAVPVSGTVTSNIGTTNGLALDTTLTSGIAKIINRGGAKGSTVAADVTSTSIDANHQGIDISDGGGSITVDGTVAVSGTVPVSVASLPLPTGAATETTLALINNKTAPLGQTTMAGSSPVTIASNQSAVPVSVASLPLPTGAATETTLAAINTKTAPLGQTTMAGSSPVTIASNQSTIPVFGHVGDGVLISGTGLIPVTMSGSDGTRVRTLKTDNLGRLLPYDENTFTAFASAIAPGNGKSMIGIYNGAGTTKILKLREIFIINTRTASVTGVAVSFELRKTSAWSGGTTITPDIHDSTDVALGGAVLTSTGAGYTESGGLLRRWIWSSDEWGPGTLDQEGHDHGFQTTFPMWKVQDPFTKPFVLNVNQGIHIKCATNTTAGTFDLIMVFSQI